MIVTARTVGREEAVRLAKAGRINLKDRHKNPYVRFVIKSTRVNSSRSRRGNGRRPLTLLEEAPSELRDLASYFTTIKIHELMAIFPSSMTASFVESESISLVDVTRVLIVAAERISKEIASMEKRTQKAERVAKNALKREKRRAKKKR